MRDCEVFTKEILQRYRSKVYTMSNAPMAEEIIKELKRRGYDPAITKLPSVQYIALTPRAKRQLENLLKRKQEKLREELAELERCQREIEESIKCQEGGKG